MISKIKALIKENRSNHLMNTMLLKDLEWANIYRDSIRGKDWLEKLPLNVGRAAVNYNFFYVLNRILSDFKPNRILEFGLGESSKFISSYILNEKFCKEHIIVEQNPEWKNSFTQRWKLSDKSDILIFPVCEKRINDNLSIVFNDLKVKDIEKFDLYVIDGPLGSKHYSRYDIVEIAEKFNNKAEFIIMIDDSHRDGEQETIEILSETLKNKGILFNKGIYSGSKSLMIIATEKYKFSCTL